MFVELLYLKNRKLLLLDWLEFKQWAKSLKKQSVGVVYFYMALYFECLINENALLQHSFRLFFDDFAHCWALFSTVQ